MVVVGGVVWPELWFVLMAGTWFRVLVERIIEACLTMVLDVRKGHAGGSFFLFFFLSCNFFFILLFSGYVAFLVSQAMVFVLSPRSLCNGRDECEKGKRWMEGFGLDEIKKRGEIVSGSTWTSRLPLVKG